MDLCAIIKIALLMRNSGKVVSFSPVKNICRKTTLSFSKRGPGMITSEK